VIEVEQSLGNRTVEDNAALNMMPAAATAALEGINPTAWAQLAELWNSVR
jgi:hypothetical protein